MGKAGQNGYPAPKQPGAIYVTGIAVISAKSADEFNNQSKQLMNKGFKIFTGLESRSIEGEGFVFSQILITEDTTKDVPNITLVKEQHLIYESDPVMFNELCAKAFKDEWFPSGLTEVKYDSGKRSVCFLQRFIKGTISTILDPYNQTGGSKIIRPS